ncbi:hypothetical protein Y032_0044g939 [Ancylostoma ceylanicum]|uniref:Uncharacterized protein n=1 Tax=Ancylostoma ceylanicum TaxID=53326 RepID=A0A016UEJ8_9BILA|nr:hypothetical protein Y032_0044g939 [Ancylostoma ceylanicum]
MVQKSSFSTFATVKLVHKSESIRLAVEKRRSLSAKSFCRSDLDRASMNLQLFTETDEYFAQCRPSLLTLLSIEGVI